MALAFAACSSNNDVVDQEYDACVRGDFCAGGFNCEPSNLPITSFTGAFCTVDCTADNQCPLLSNNFSTICINQQCVLQCPTGSQTCPYGQQCVTFSDADNPGDVFDICTP
jgi:hypothetical protein